MCGTRNRQKFSDAFNDGDDNGLKDVHGVNLKSNSDLSLETKLPFY